jgi:hypothetical protein
MLGASLAHRISVPLIEIETSARVSGEARLRGECEPGERANFNEENYDETSRELF